MRLSFRLHILLTLVPLLALLAVLGGSAAVLLFRLGSRIDAILRENYDSVRYMEDLREALDEIDTSYRLALAGQDDTESRKKTTDSWDVLNACIRDELNNITLPGEQAMADRLAELGREYRQHDEAFWQLPPFSQGRRDAYRGRDGLEVQYRAIRDQSRDILVLNQQNMEEEEEAARTLARRSLIGFGVGLGLAVMLGLWLAWHTIQSTLRPLRLVTASARAIGEGNLDQVVPVLANDELGQLAGAFNAMARQLRAYRQAGLARLSRAQQTSQATIDSFPDPVVVVDTSGKAEMANPAARRLLGDGWQPTGDLALRLQEAIHERRPYLPEEFDRAVRIIAGGRETFFLPRILPIEDPERGTIGAAVLLQDVTRFRLLDRVKSDLVATVSHELKTPLTSIRLALHLLLEEVVGPLTPKQAELLVDARDNGERLLRMVNNLLDLARLERGTTLEMHPESPATLVRAAADLIRPRATDRNVHLFVEAGDDLPEVGADAPRIGHVLNNLLDNALTHTPAGGRITISAAAKDGVVEFTVADTGSGIAPEHVPHIFDKFYRIPGEKEAGTGLGLAIVREVVTAHGGSVSCESQPGDGSIFRITLPVGKPV